MFWLNKKKCDFFGEGLAILDFPENGSLVFFVFLHRTVKSEFFCAIIAFHEVFITNWASCSLKANAQSPADLILKPPIIIIIIIIIVISIKRLSLLKTKRLFIVLREQYPDSTHAQNFDFCSSCREIKRCEKSRRKQACSEFEKEHQKLYLFKRTDQYSGREISLKIAWVSTG